MYKMKNPYLLKEHKSWVCSDSSVIESQLCQTICVNRLRGEKTPQTFLFSQDDIHATSNICQELGTGLQKLLTLEEPYMQQ